MNKTPEKAAPETASNKTTNQADDKPRIGVTLEHAKRGDDCIATTLAPTTNFGNNAICSPLDPMRPGAG